MGFVKNRFKILEYYRVYSVFKSVFAAPMDVIYDF